VNDASAPSPWANERFGGFAPALMTAIPLALQAAHLRALAAYRGLGLESRDAYGLLWHVQHEELVKHVLAVADARILNPVGARYDLLMIGEQNIILYPWKFADDAYSPLTAAKMRLSEVRRNLLALTIEQSDDGQMTIEQATLTEEELAEDDDEARRTLQEMISAGRMVLIAYASNPHAGLLRLPWGDASQASKDGRLNWSYLEDIPFPGIAQGNEDSGGAPLRPVGPTTPPTPASGGARFDRGPLEEPALGLRPPLTSPDNDPQGPQPETGSDD
jgi:hypothetical protein